MPDMTERQADDWPGAIAEAQRYVDTSTIPKDIDHYEWCVNWERESRPGRGSYLRAMWCDGEYVVSIFMDVYGAPRVAVAQTDWVHNGSDEECECDACVVERAAEADPGSPDSGSDQ